MGCQPILNTKRLILRPFSQEDVPELLPLVNAPEIAATTVRIPHPYPEELARSWIRQQPRLFETGEGATFALIRRRTGTLVGCIGLTCDLENRNAELGYWIGVPYWNRSYATEAARMAVAFGFAYFGLHRIRSAVFGSNPASGRVLEKIGMHREGRRREQLFKEGRGFEDIVDYGLLASDFTRQAMGG